MFYLFNYYYFSGLGYLYLAFFIWMLIDCYQREPDRLIWMLVMWFLQPLGAIVYFFARYLPRGQFTGFRWLTSKFQTGDQKRLHIAAQQIGNAYHWIQYGDKLRETGKTQPAAEAYRNALAKEPNNLQALWGLTTCLDKLKQPQEALQLTGQILASDPEYKFGDVSLAKGRLLVQLDEWEQAHEHLEKHVSRWRQPEGLYLLAQAKQRTGDTEAARSHLRDLIMDIEASPAAIARKQAGWKRKANSLLRSL